MTSPNNFNILYVYGLFAFMTILPWYFAHKSPANSHSRKVMGHQLISTATLYVIADLALLFFMPDVMDWVIYISLLGFAVISYIVGAKVLNSYQEDEVEDCKAMSEHTIVVHYCKTDDNYCARLSDNVPGAVVFTAETYEELTEEADKTILFHVEGMIKDGDDVPEWLANGEYDIEFVKEESE